MPSARILIVEDEPIVAKDLARKVEQLGYRVVAIARSAPHAIEQARLLGPDLVLMDVGLPGAMDGRGAAAQICAQRPIPIVYLTGYPMEDVTTAGPLLCLHKPIDEPALRDILARALDALPPPLAS